MRILPRRKLAWFALGIFGTIVVNVQFVQNDMTGKSRSRMLLHPTASLQDLSKNTKQLLHEALKIQNKPIRRLGVKVSELSDVTGQLNIDDYF